MHRLYLTPLLVFLISLTSFAQAPQSTPTARSLTKSAAEHMNAGRLDEALADVNKAIELDANYLAAFVTRLFIWNKKDVHKDTSDDCTRIIELDPNGKWTEFAYLMRATYRFQRQDVDGAIGDVTHAIALNPVGSSFSLRSYGYLIKGDVVKARNDYDKSLQLDQNSVSPFVRRGSFLFQPRTLSSALADFDSAIEWKNDYAEAWSYRGTTLGLMGNVTEAIESLVKAGSLDRGAISDENRGSFRSPFLHLNTLVNGYPSYARAYGVRAIFRMLQGKDNEADGDFRKAVELEPLLKFEVERAREEARQSRARLMN